ncbi:hypothetical protein NDU88_007439 [Pleurodeles waltl]|uniref:UPAR/Ly6 domain-containing protein n=1 Tax=Pleurodeles waltl TaxID=8319 RepID=A0AAV7TZS0_PLEWA|nr:hypothetical protein NDU88_007439 [Pleurodeles waltl]
MGGARSGSSQPGEGGASGGVGAGPVRSDGRGVAGPCPADSASPEPALKELPAPRPHLPERRGRLIPLLRGTQPDEEKENMARVGMNGVLLAVSAVLLGLFGSGSARLTTCLAYNSCNNDFLAKEYNLGTFSYDCCQKELCNSSVMTVVNKTIMSLVAMLALVWICF